PRSTATSPADSNWSRNSSVTPSTTCAEPPNPSAATRPARPSSPGSCASTPSAPAKDLSPPSSSPNPPVAPPSSAPAAPAPSPPANPFFRAAQRNGEVRDDVSLGQILDGLVALAGIDNDPDFPGAL